VASDEARPAAPAPGASAYQPQSDPEPSVRGGALLRALESVFLRLEAGSRRLLPDAWNPLLHSGAIANTMLLVATATGVALLIWYSPSVHLAHASMRAIEGNLLASVVRAVHRSSSDLCVLFVTWHALRLFSSRRFTGARWLAWVTGLVATGLMWLVGWLGYWLVWDEAAQLVAVATARVLDVLPIFTDPLSREFLADGTVNSLLFFIVFFIHMLLPMAMGVALWLHIARLQRADLFTAKKPTLVLVGLLVALALLVPPRAGALARLALVPGRLTIDGWYLAPLAIAERLSGGASLALLLGVGAVLFAVPWALARGRRKPATVVESRCNACNQCVTDCPYGAIRLVPRTDGRAFEARALVDESACLGCGICAGSCAGGGSTLPHFDMLLERARLEKLVAAAGPKPLVFLCHDVLPAGLVVDEESGACAQLPGSVVRQVPCAGWVHAITLERALRAGVPQVVVVGCAGCRFREGVAWAQERFTADRHVAIRRAEDRARVHLVTADRTSAAALVATVQAALGGTPPAPRRLPAWATAPVTLGAVGALVTLGSLVPFTPTPRPTPVLAVSFRHAGAIEEQCRELSAEEKARQPPHMRHDTECHRKRAAVRLEVSVDGAPAATRRYEPKGLWGDGAAKALEEFPLPAGRHRVAVRIGESADESTWAFSEEREVELRDGERRAVVFDRAHGFQWYPEVAPTDAGVP
jgi:ferredoxin/coenzyme F420-reducing hydrogenase delta subunit